MALSQRLRGKEKKIIEAEIFHGLVIVIRFVKNLNEGGPLWPQRLGTL